MCNEEEAALKKYLTAIFILLSVLSVVIGFRLDVRWNGIFSWGLAIFFLFFAAYFTKYISDKKPKSSCEEKKE